MTKLVEFESVESATLALDPPLMAEVVDVAVASRA